MGKFKDLQILMSEAIEYTIQQEWDLAKHDIASAKANTLHKVYNAIDEIAEEHNLSREQLDYISRDICGDALDAYIDAELYSTWDA